MRSGNIVFAAPPIRRHHLHARLRRDLERRGHTVSVLTWSRPARTFWQAQRGLVHGLPRTSEPLGDVPCAELALRTAAPWQSRAAVTRRLLAFAPRARAWLAEHRPDLLLFHAAREPEHLLLQFLARQLGVPVWWTGDGLLPHTMQHSERGLDGDALPASRRAADFRVVTAEPALVSASLAAALGAVQPVALPRGEVQVPALRQRALDALLCLCTGRFGEFGPALNGHRQALLPWPELGAPERLPPAPFAVVLLQARHDARTWLDADGGYDPAALLDDAARAVRSFDNGLGLAVVLPDAAPPALVARVRAVGAVPVAAAAAAPAAATATLALTINHEAATIALCAGTPVVHLGRAAWALPGVTTQVRDADWAAALREAVDREQPRLRTRFLTWLLRHGTLWCSPDAPDHNGMLGLVQAIERRLAPNGDGSAGRSAAYRTGPAWPLGPRSAGGWPEQGSGGRAAGPAGGPEPPFASS